MRVGGFCIVNCIIISFNCPNKSRTLSGLISLQITSQRSFYLLNSYNEEFQACNFDEWHDKYSFNLIYFM
jgi:hypothetical protein